MEQNGTPAGEGELIVALAAGTAVRQAARQAGISERTVYRRLAEADFRRAVKEARDRQFDAAQGSLAGLASQATETLERLMQSDKPSVALGAAKVVLEMGARLRRSNDLQERMNRLREDEVDEKVDGNQTPAADDELVRALAGGASVREAAEQAGVEEQTAHLRLADPDFRRAVSQARDPLFQIALGRLASLASQATAILARLMQSDQPTVARRAAKAVLQLGPRLRESAELIRRLEDKADKKAKRKPRCVVID